MSAAVALGRQSCRLADLGESPLVHANKIAYMSAEIRMPICFERG